MATDRENFGRIKIITRVTYEKIDGDLWQRTRVKVKDLSDTVQIISDDIINVGRKQDFKRGLVEERRNIQGILDNTTSGFTDQIEFLNEQITDIEAL